MTLSPSSMTEVPEANPRHPLPTALAFGGTSCGNGPLPPACSHPQPAPNRAGHSPPISPGIVVVGGGCVNPGFPPHATLLHYPQSPAVGGGCASQAVGRYRLGQGGTRAGLGGTLL